VEKVRKVNPEGKKQQNIYTKGMNVKKEVKNIAEDSMGHDNTHRQLKEELSKDKVQTMKEG
jgi:rubrerythrin